MLYYSESGGSTYSLSVGVAYGIGSVSLGIPLGKITTGTFGAAVKATGKGYYKFKLTGLQVRLALRFQCFIQ